MGPHCPSLVLASAPITYSTHRVLGVHGKVRPHRPADTPVRIWSTHTQVCCCADDTLHTAELHSPLLLLALRRSAPSRGLLWDLPGAGGGGTAGMGGGFWIGLDVCHGILMGFHEGVRAIFLYLVVSHHPSRSPRGGSAPRRGRTCGLSGLILSYMDAHSRWSRSSCDRAAARTGRIRPRSPVRHSSCPRPLGFGEPLPTLQS